MKGLLVLVLTAVAMSLFPIFAAAQNTPASTAVAATDDVASNEARFVAPSELISPLILTQGERAALIALTYEFCSGMKPSIELIKRVAMEQQIIETASDLATALRVLDYPDEGKFYEDCARKKR